MPNVKHSLVARYD